MVRIGQASLGSEGRVRGDKAGNQNGKELNTRSWHDGNWNVMLRARNPEVAEKIAKNCEAACANRNIGYDQNQRNTAHTEAKKVGYDLSKITTPCETDCSALATLCAIAAGVKGLEYTGNAPTTSTMRRAFTMTGEFEAYTESKYLRGSEYLKRGDILIREGKHTVMVLDNGSKAGTAAGTKSLMTIASEVLKGKWGNGEDRKKRLEAAGYPYRAVQAEVNRLIRESQRYQ